MRVFVRHGFLRVVDFLDEETLLFEEEVFFLVDFFFDDFFFAEADVPVDVETVVETQTVDIGLRVFKGVDSVTKKQPAANANDKI